jgi:hypothetical protein
MNVKVADIRPTHYNKCLPIWKELQQARGGIVNLENTGERFNIALVNLMVCETTRARLTACDSFVESYDGKDNCGVELASLHACVMARR